MSILNDPNDFKNRQLNTALSMSGNVKVQHVFLTNEGTCLNLPYHAIVHEHNPLVLSDYINIYTTRYFWNDWDDDVPAVAEMDNPTLVVWATEGMISHSSMWTTTSTSTSSTTPTITVAKGNGWIDPSNPNIVPTRTLVGKYTFYTAWFNGHYGHMMHDHFPTMAYLQKITNDKYGKDNAKYILVDTKKAKEIVQFLDPDMYQRVEWIQQGEVIQVQGQVMYVMPNGRGAEHNGHVLMSYLRNWLVQVHPMDYRDYQVNKHVLFYDRSSSSDVHGGRVLNAQIQEQILATIRKYMDKYGMKEEPILIYNGQDENGHTLSVEQQFLAFRRASAIIGPHGTGISSMVWTNPNPKGCEARTKVLEFMCTSETENIHSAFQGYYRSFRSLPLDYHELFYQPPSTIDNMFINISDLEDALEAMWGGKQIIQIEPTPSYMMTIE